jgi:hypothetical protein
MLLVPSSSLQGTFFNRLGSSAELDFRFTEFYEVRLARPEKLGNTH